MALVSALLLPTLPAQASEATPAPVVADAAHVEAAADGPLHRDSPTDPATDHWRDTEALPGQRIFIPFEGTAGELGELRVEVAEAFPGFRAQVQPDHSIRVKVPQSFPGVTQASPVFTVSDHRGAVDTFSVDVEYPRPRSTEPEPTSLLVQMISELVLRLPQLPWLAQLLLG